jgi:hypothetical protein
MVQLRQKQPKYEYYVDSNLVFYIQQDIQSTELNINFKQDERLEEEIPDPTQDPDYLRFRNLSKEEFHLKMEKLEQRQLKRLLQLKIPTEQQNVEQLPFCFTRDETIVFKHTRDWEREKVLKRLNIKSKFITRLPKLKLTFNPTLAFGHPLPQMTPKDFDL